MDLDELREQYESGSLSGDLYVSSFDEKQGQKQELDKDEYFFIREGLVDVIEFFISMAHPGFREIKQFDTEYQTICNHITEFGIRGICCSVQNEVFQTEQDPNIQIAKSDEFQCLKEQF